MYRIKPTRAVAQRKVACSPLSGRHEAPPVQELHLSLPQAQKEDHPGLHNNSVPVSCKPYTLYRWSINPVTIPQLRHARKSSAEPEVCGSPCAFCALCQAIGWSGKRIMRLWQILWAPDQGRCSLHVQRGCFPSNPQSLGPLLLW